MRGVILALILLLPVMVAEADPPAGSFRALAVPDSVSKLERILVDAAVGLGAEESGVGALIEIDLNAWRSASPDDFVPGPMNDILGAVGLADARTLGLAIQGDGLAIRWDRRMRADGEQAFVVATKQTSSGKSYEEWGLSGVKPGQVVRTLARIWFAIVPPEGGASSWVRFDRYTRSRSSLLASVDRACESASIMVTDDEAVGIVFEFVPAVKEESLRRAIDRVVPIDPSWTETATTNHRILGTISIRGNEFRPSVVIGRIEERPVVVIGLSTDASRGVFGSLNESPGG